MKRLRVGILATGKIAQRLAGVIKASETCELVAAASRSEEKALQFAKEFQTIPVAGYDNLLQRDDVDAIYVATPHPQHHEWCLRAIESGKHILCEKPFTMTFAEAEEIIKVAKKYNRLVMEAFMYRYHPQTRKLIELVNSSVIGDIRWIHADFGFAAAYEKTSRLFANSLGGGGILDVGCYTVSMVRLIAGAATGAAFLDPLEIKALGKLNSEEVTDWMAGALLNFSDELLGSVRCGTRCNLGQRVRIEGTKGVIEVTHPWFAGAPGALIRMQITGEEDRIISTEQSADLYSYMIDEFARCVRAGETESPLMNWKDTLGNMRVLEDWYRQVNVVYESEK